MANVTIRDAEKYYGTFHALKEVSVDIADGEFVVLVGPSGCGKSTLLRMIAGLEDITGGDILHRRPAWSTTCAPKDRDIAMVFQNYALYPHMTVARTWPSRCSCAKRRRPRSTSGSTRAAEILGLDAPARPLPAPALRRPAPARRDGPRHRARSRRSSCSTSRCPTSTPSCACRCAPRSRNCTSGSATTTIYVTHDQIEAMTLADRIVVMRDGVIEQVGTPLELYDRPANSFVAGFIGSPAMNLLAASARPAASASPTSVLIPSGPADPATTTLGVRPEHL